MTATVGIGEQAVIFVRRELGYREIRAFLVVEHKGVQKNVCAEGTT